MIDKTFREKIDGVSYKIENNESHTECISRECIEDIGYDVRVNEYIGASDMYMFHEKRGYFHPVQYFYLGEISKKIKEPIEEDHILEWVPINDLESKIYLKIQLWAIKKVTKENYI